MCDRPIRVRHRASPHRGSSHAPGGAGPPRCAAVQGGSGRVVCVEDPGSQDTLIGSFFIWTTDEISPLGRLASTVSYALETTPSFYHRTALRE